MTVLHNPQFLTFQGDALGGRSPMVMRVPEGVALNEYQLQGARSTFIAFNTAAALSPAKFHSWTKQLDDGTSLSITTINERVVMDITPPPATNTSVQVLPHGLAVVAEGKLPCVYGRVNGTWKVTALNPPQLKGITSYSFKETAGANGLEVTPHVGNGNKYWEFNQRDGYAATPFVPQYLSGGTRVGTATDFLGGAIYAKTGAVLVPGPVPTAILSKDDPPHKVLPSDLSTDENTVVLQAYRKAVISPTAGVVQYRFVASVVSRQSADTYEAVLEGGGSSTDFSTGTHAAVSSTWFVAPGLNPVITVASAGGAGSGFGHAALSGPGGIVVVFEATSDPRYDPREFVEIHGSAGTVGAGLIANQYQQTSLGYGTESNWVYGSRTQLQHWAMVVYTRKVLVIGRRSDAEMSTNNGGWYDARIERAPTADEVKPVTWGVVAGRNAGVPLTLISTVCYPTIRRLFRAGTEQITPSQEGGTLARYGYMNVTTRSSEHWTRAAPKLQMPTAWRTENKILFGGTTEGTLVGRYHHVMGIVMIRNFESDRPYIPGDLPGGADSVDQGGYPGVPIGTVYTVGKDQYDACLDLAQNHYISDFYNQRVTDGAGGVIPPTPNPEWRDYDPNGVMPAIIHQLCINKAKYDLESFYITDFDYNSRFMAGIRVSVKCEGYEHRSANKVGGEEGNLVQHTPAVYAVTIEFITEWTPDTGGTTVTTTTELFKHKEAVLKPNFEFEKPASVNPWNTGDVRLWWYRMPPKIQPPVEFYSQMDNLLKSQGQNTHYASSINPDGWKSASMFSSAGVEWSTKGARSLGKYPPGMLYARKLKLSDFPDAFWLLDSTKCNCQQTENLDGTDKTRSYFYMSSLGDRIASTEVIDFQLRDGVRTSWVDDLPNDPAVVQPAGARDIKLYRI